MKGRKVKKNDIFDRLIVIEVKMEPVGKCKKSFAYCKCECGNNVRCRATDLVQGRQKSCGCLKAENASKRMSQYNKQFEHGHTDTRLYKIWAGMKTRCTNPNQQSYKDYGGRGITVCEEWLSNFLSFYNWAIENGYQDGLTLERIDNNGNYCPTNCTWITMKEQSWNRRNSIKQDITAFGETKAAHEWEQDERCVVKLNTLLYRIGAGWNSETAITKSSERKINRDGKYSLAFCRYVHKHYPEIFEEFNNANNK